MYDLTRFTLRNVAECGLALRRLGQNAGSMEAISQQVVQYFYQHFIHQETSLPACALVQFFKTCSYQELPFQLQNQVHRGSHHIPVSPSLKCLTLLASTGEYSEWNSRQSAIRQQVIPLVSQEEIAQLPMISQLFQQFGLEPSIILEPNLELLPKLEQREYNVFYIPDAINSPYLLAQNSFVMPLQVKSIVGFGGLLPSGEMFAVLLFLKVLISRETADSLRLLAPNIKLAILPFDRGVTFETDRLSSQPKKLVDCDRDCVATLKSQNGTLRQLLDMSEQLTLIQSDRLEQATTTLQHTLEVVRAAQLYFAQEDKISDLGQIVAGVTQEINTSINFVRDNISPAYEYIHDLLNLLKLYQQHYPNPGHLVQQEIAVANLDFIEEKLPKLITSVQSEVDHIHTVIKSVRNFSQFDGTEIQTINLHECIDSILVILNHRLTDKFGRPIIKVIKDYDSLPYIEGYPNQLIQAFMYLIKSMIEALEECHQERSFRQVRANPNTLFIRTELLTNGWVRIRIINNELNPSAKFALKLFDSFLTVNPGSKEVEPRLSTIHQIVKENHSGKLFCPTREKGTEFVVEIPILQPTSQPLNSVY